MKERASAVGEGHPILDASDFTTKPAGEVGVPIELLRAAAEAAKFPSREPIYRRAPRLYRTGRTMQFSVRASPETIEAIYSIADGNRWQVSETIERAIAALKRELAGTPSCSNA